MIHFDLGYCRKKQAVHIMMRSAAISTIGIALLLSACSRSPSELLVSPEPSPAAGKSLVPQVTTLKDGRVAASWLEPLPERGYTFQMAIRNGDTWSPVRTIARGEDLVMFSAHFPGLVETQTVAYSPTGSDSIGPGSTSMRQ